MITETRTHMIGPDITVFEISGRLNLGNLLMSVENAVRWIRNLEPGDATPNPEVSKAEDERAVQVWRGRTKRACNNENRN